MEFCIYIDIKMTPCEIIGFYNWICSLIDSCLCAKDISYINILLVSLIVHFDKLAISENLTIIYTVAMHYLNLIFSILWHIR